MAMEKCWSFKGFDPTLQTGIFLRFLFHINLFPLEISKMITEKVFKDSGRPLTYFSCMWGEGRLVNVLRSNTDNLLGYKQVITWVWAYFLLIINARCWSYLVYVCSLILGEGFLAGVIFILSFSDSCFNLMFDIQYTDFF